MTTVAHPLFAALDKRMLVAFGAEPFRELHESPQGFGLAGAFRFEGVLVMLAPPQSNDQEWQHILHRIRDYVEPFGLEPRLGYLWRNPQGNEFEASALSRLMSAIWSHEPLTDTQIEQLLHVPHVVTTIGQHTIIVRAAEESGIGAARFQKAMYEAWGIVVGDKLRPCFTPSYTSVPRTHRLP